MSLNLSRKILYAFVFILFVSLVSVEAQTENKQINFQYSQNPKIRTKPTENDIANNEKLQNQSDNPKGEKVDEQNKSVSLASKTLEVAKRSKNVSVSPTETYKVGINDILFVSLQNDRDSSTYYTVLNDGTIDYPLAGELISVENLTTDEIEDLLREKIKLFKNPQVSVKVREHASHEINVLGLVENAGKKYIQREAIPLFVVRAESIVRPEALQVTIKRKNADTEVYDLKDSKYENVLIFPGDIVEFTGNAKQTGTAAEFYFIGGLIKDGGQKDFHDGITLTQAILASGGVKNPKADKVIIRRKDEKGLLKSSAYDLSKIKKGKMPDPTLNSGDTIEILN